MKMIKSMSMSKIKIKNKIRIVPPLRGGLLCRG
jgi:hypothetical protein